MIKLRFHKGTDEVSFGTELYRTNPFDGNTAWLHDDAAFSMLHHGSTGATLADNQDGEPAACPHCFHVLHGGPILCPCCNRHP